MAKTAKAKGGKGGKGKVIVLAVVALVVILGGTGAGLYFMGFFGGGETAGEPEPQQDAEMALGTPVFHEYEEMLVDLRTDRCRAPFLRFVMVVQVGESDRKRLDTFDLRIKDRVQNHIRSYARQDLVGEEGANRIRTDLVAVINNIIKPAQIHAVLFKSFVLN